MNRVLSNCIALACIAAALTSTAQQPSSFDAQRRAALALEQQGKNTEAEAAWRAILKAHPNNPEPYAQIGVIEARQEHFKEAVPLYRKALAINPAVPGLRLNLALALFKAGDLKAAIPEFQTVLRNVPASSPDGDRCTILIGMAYYGLADYAHAIPYLQQAANRDSSSLPLLLALAHSYLWSRQFQNVLDVYHQILILNPESAEADMIVGEALDEMKDNEGSTRMFRAAVKADPKEPNVHFGLGYLLWTQKQYPEAAQEFQAELVNDPNHVQSSLYLADTKLQMNQPADAEPMLRKVVQSDPSLALAHLDLGIIATDAGRHEDALRELVLAEKLMPNDVNVHWRLARLYRDMGKKDEAKVEFDKASTLTKAADEDLHKKIAAGKEHSPDQKPAPPPTEK